MFPTRWLRLATSLFLAVALSAPSRADDDVALVGLSDLWQYQGFSPEAVPPPDWRTESFDDSGWYTGPSGFGTTTYGESTRLPTTNGWERILLRTRFQGSESNAVRWLSLRADYGGGFVAWLNGVEIARRGLAGLPESIPPLRADPVPRPAGAAELIPILPAAEWIRPGTNVLAVQLHSDGLYSRWPVFTAELLANFARAPYLQNVRSNRAEILFATPTDLPARVEFGIQSVSERSISSPSQTRHVVVLEGLVPGQRYTYRVVLGEGTTTATTQPRTFRTLPLEGDLTVQVIGDSGGADIWQHRVTERMAADGADLMLHAGDIIYPAFHPALSDIRFLSVQRPLMRSTPTFFAWGNHDLLYGTAPFLEVLRSPTNDTAAADHFLERTLPQSYYSFDAGDVHFVVLFQPFASQYLLRPDNPQARWLERDLASTTKPWKVLISHLPTETSGLHRPDDFNFNGRRDSQEFADALLPLVRRHGVQLLLAGHDHDYERFIPTDGFTSIVTGGGGGPPYGLRETDPRSATFLAVYHYTRLRFEGPRLTIQCIDWQGRIQDESVVHRLPPPVRIHTATAGTPTQDPPTDGRDGLFSAPEIPSFTGRQSNLGSLRVMMDDSHLHLGLDRIAISGGSDLYLLLEVPGLTGVDSLAGLGNGQLDAGGQGVDALDFGKGLSFTRFHPSVAAVVGDGAADSVLRGFRRAGSTNALGQGVFRLDATFRSVPGTRLRQSSRPPPGGGLPEERPSAERVEISIPLAELGDLAFGQEIRVGAVVGLDWNDGSPQRRFDDGFLGDSAVATGGRMVLEGLRVRLPDDPDPDRDGLPTAAEQLAGTDPRHPDTDLDGLPDGWEVRHRLNPLSPAGGGDRNGDPDNDGYNNLEEFQLGTDPTDRFHPFQLKASPSSRERIQLQWRAGRGRRYALEASDAIGSPFLLLDGFPRAAEQGVETAEVPIPGSVRFFRLRALD